MRKNILSTVVMLGIGMAVSACDSDQPTPGCVVQDSASAPWFGKYDLVEGPVPVEAGVTCTAASQAPAGEDLGVWKFYDVSTNKAALTIRPRGLASLGSKDPNNKYSDLQGTGGITNDVDANQFCNATDFNLAKVNAVDGASTTAISYQFSNVRVYSAPSAPGTQLTGELTYIKNGCKSTYVVRAIWPSTPCDPTADASDPANAIDTCGEGSGVNPDFDVVCDATVKKCVAAKAIPSFKK
ncbi:hypothetical protein JGU66_09380 [Myxococcaceae bacterium JPH2]|nr:hypothetical protein [Myxococcaceae bacterium JPH2]